uniref:TOG domain-containing protein n=1 Tax=Setaria digitata TaxID=48799 RepID=A0A915PRN8_9BILA
MDGCALLNEVNIIGCLPTGFFESIRSPRWTERRDTLLALIDILSQYPRIDPKIKYNEIVSELKLIILKDSNVVVVALALRALAAFIKGLRKNFILLHILEKFKEKKASVKEAVMDCLSLVAEHCDSGILIGPICEALEKATNPSVKSSIDQWIYCILCHYPQSAAPISFIKNVGPYLVKHSKDGDPDVREGSCMAFGAISRLVEKEITSSIADEVFRDKTKFKKITEYFEKAEKDFEAYEQARIKSHMEMQFCAPGEDAENNEEFNSGSVQPDAAISRWELLTETKISDKIPRDIQAKLTSKQWKERKELLYNILEKNPRLCPDEDCSELVGALLKTLEKDVNINVAAVAARCITAFANGLRYRFATFIPKIYGSVFEKFKERKVILREPLIELCDVLALLAPLPAYIDAVETALQKPNPQIKAQTALFISRLLRQHNMYTLPLDCVRQKLGPALTKLSSDADPDTRDASFVAVGAIMRIVGESVVNICCAEVMQDDNKAIKVRENCKALIKEFGLNASNQILKLHQEMRSTSAVTKIKNDKVHSDSKIDSMTTKKISKSLTHSRPKFNSAVVPAARIQSTRAAMTSLSVVEAKCNEPRVLSAKLRHTMEEANGGQMRKNVNMYEKNSSSEKDVFFDAAEEMEVTSRSSSEPDNSVCGNNTYIVEKKESITEETVSSLSISHETKRSATASSIVPSACNCGSRLPSRLPRGTSGSRIPIPIHRRT